MAMRCAIRRMIGRSTSSSTALTSVRRWLSGQGKILSEEEMAKENVYIKKMERERMERLKKKLEMNKAEAEKLTGKSSATEIYPFLPY
ncbi:F1F0-ATPase inhibitor protein isoform X3 [Wolffia australiana]